ncbi:MAG: hypothetical protein N5P05_001243 [Chroococcopsis gigantea SAG 12.99]|jgi:IS605 OrfB family transposase|nr:IS200/IS605 family accessory protein TnpB-related protein [Chlorogloea purpurea SAG 13.99]MDV2999637.1 hypothetical protein [Chroococcopsis gigantea SAG 12.99]
MGRQHGLSVGIETKIHYHPILDVIGEYYESWRRTALNWLQSGLTEKEVEKKLQKEFNLQWAWADSIATEALSTLAQLRTSKENNITDLKNRIKAKNKRASLVLKDLEKRIEKPFLTRTDYDLFKLELMGLKFKILKIESLKRELKELENSERLHICFGSRKLFNAQHHLKENRYESHQEWLEDWRKKRSGRFYCVGKGVSGGGTMMKIFPTSDEGDYRLDITVPRPLIPEFGKLISIPFKVNDRAGRRMRGDLNYALSEKKPITTQVFRREHKNDGWYLHLTTYVEEIPSVHNRKNGCIGLDFNADTISATYVKRDGNIGYCQEFPYQWKGLTTGQRQALMRDVVKEIVSLAEKFNCAIAIESLDFSKKKATMSEESKLYNEMLSNLSTDLFRTTLESRCKRYGVQLIKINPAFTSIVGMLKFMSRLGLNSGTSAAMSIARRAMNLSEKLPSCLEQPEDRDKHAWSSWNRVARYIKSHRIRRTQLFQWTKALKGILTVPDTAEHQPLMPVNIEIGEHKNPHHSPMDVVSSFV